MCLAVPAKIIEIDGENATVEYGGVRRKAIVSMVPDAGIGDYVLIHAGFAIQKMERTGRQGIQRNYEGNPILNAAT